MRVLTQAGRLGVALALLAAVFAPKRAPAAAVDVAGLNCADLAKADPDERRQIVLWLSGYYAGTAGRPLVDQDRVIAAAEALDQVCARRGDLPLIGVETRALLAGEATAAQLAPPPPPPPAPAAATPGSRGRSVPRPLPPR